VVKWLALGGVAGALLGLGLAGWLIVSMGVGS